jgi:hypothetical protein
VSYVNKRYVLTKRVEKLIPLRRLTTIVMPHRGPRASLRQAKVPAPVVAECLEPVHDLRRMSAIQVLKHGLSTNLWRKEGWLHDLLKEQGIVDGSKQSRKELCWSYYKSQQLYIEAMKEARNDDDFDPRRNEHVTGKDGKFMKKTNGTTKPKNPLTVLYLLIEFLPLPVKSNPG